jgi:hypothetical protein
MVIYIKDIQIIMGRKRGTAAKLYWEIMKANDKKEGQYLTFREFRSYTGITQEEIDQYIHK